MLGNRPDQFIQQMELDNLVYMRSRSQVPTCIEYRALLEGTALFEVFSVPADTLYGTPNRLDENNNKIWPPGFVQKVLEHNDISALKSHLMNVLLSIFYTFYCDNLFFQGAFNLLRKLLTYST